MGILGDIFDWLVSEGLPGFVKSVAGTQSNTMEMIFSKCKQEINTNTYAQQDEELQDAMRECEQMIDEYRSLKRDYEFHEDMRDEMADLNYLQQDIMSQLDYIKERIMEYKYMEEN